ncbi:hypothetical protein AB1Y20_021484 [Prymnesium parvum]|uniref:fructose-bisphosphate aldolase n=1 Tax=Prymnesium parvum TaxID=97485 RepID=A0AB34JLC3_PRYPA
MIALLVILAAGGAAALASRACSSALASCLSPRAARMLSPFEMENPFLPELCKTARFVARRGHGILAADESSPTAGKRLMTIGLENSESNRRQYREMLCTTPGLCKYISGVIMSPETLFQTTSDGRRFVDVLVEQGIVPGVKVDTGLCVMPGSGGETATQGLDGLGERCRAYYAEGARFAKWRAVFKISATTPSERAMVENAQALARYASICQEHGLCPIIEPEVTLGPGDYSIGKAAHLTERVLSHVYRALNMHDVVLEATLLKPSMVLPGLDALTVPKEEVAEHTLRTLMRTVPPAVPGILFLSGGMSAQEATNNLQQLQRIARNAPWTLSFSFGRALLESVLTTWGGQPANVKAAQHLLLELARVNGEAQLGIWNEEHPAANSTRTALPKLSYSSERAMPSAELFNW